MGLKMQPEVLKTVNDHGSVLINASGHVFGKKINSIVSYSVPGVDCDHCKHINGANCEHRKAY